MKMADIEVQTVEEFQRRNDITERIWAHYDHAKKKHPYFCDLIKSDELPFDFVGWKLEGSRKLLAHAKAAGVVRWDKLLDCEKYEAMAEIHRGNNAAAVEELYDAIAVLLRTIDVLEGRQGLGKPKGGEK